MNELYVVHFAVSVTDGFDNVQVNVRANHFLRFFCKHHCAVACAAGEIAAGGADRNHVPCELVSTEVRTFIGVELLEVYIAIVVDVDPLARSVEGPLVRLVRQQQFQMV